MRKSYIIIGMAIFAMLLFFNLAHAQSSNVTASNITTAINLTLQYVNNINQSSYLIFYPNLTKAYADINLARNESQINAPYSYVLLAKARQEAQYQLSLINQYRSESLYVLIIFGILFVILLYVLMKPANSGRNARKRGK